MKSFVYERVQEFVQVSKHRTKYSSVQALESRKREGERKREREREREFFVESVCVTTLGLC